MFLRSAIDVLLVNLEQRLQGLNVADVERLDLLANTVVASASFEGVTALQRVDLLRLATVGLANVPNAQLALPHKTEACLPLILRVLRALGRDPVKRVCRSRVQRWQLPLSALEAWQMGDGTLLQSATHLYLNEEDLQDQPDLPYFRAIHQFLLVMHGQRDIFSCSHPLPDPQRLLFNVRHFYSPDEAKRLLEVWEVDEVYEGVTDPDVAAWVNSVTQRNAQLT